MTRGKRHFHVFMSVCDCLFVYISTLLRGWTSRATGLTHGNMHNVTICDVSLNNTGTKWDGTPPPLNGFVNGILIVSCCLKRWRRKKVGSDGLSLARAGVGKLTVYMLMRLPPHKHTLLRRSFCLDPFDNVVATDICIHSLTATPPDGCSTTDYNRHHRSEFLTTVAVFRIPVTTKLYPSNCFLEFRFAFFRVSNFFLVHTSLVSFKSYALVGLNVL